MWSKIILFLIISVYSYNANGSVAPFINKCDWEDSKCITASANAVRRMFAEGIPSLGVRRTDPLILKNLDASSTNLKLLLSDLAVTGLKECDILEIKRDRPKSKLYVSAECDTLDLKGHYVIGGKILILPIEGNGNGHIVLRKIVVTLECDIDYKNDKEGIKHWIIKGWKHTFDLKGDSTIELDNLFDGNEVLSKAVKELLATSSNEVILDAGPPLVQAIVKRIMETCQQFYNKVPASELESN